MVIVKFFAACILAAMLPTAGSAASFNCNLARSVSEKLICSDPELSQKDDQLAVLYAAALDRAQDPKAFAQEGARRWEDREKSCSDKACLLTWYAERTEELSETKPSIPAATLADTERAVSTTTPPPDTETSSDGAGWIFVLAIGFVLLYFLPGITASIRNHHNKTAIGVVNFFFGWTLIGWVIALVWALTNKPPPQVVIVKQADGKP